jgi:hypothetical protein
MACDVASAADVTSARGLLAKTARTLQLLAHNLIIPCAGVIATWATGNTSWLPLPSDSHDGRCANAPKQLHGDIYHWAIASWTLGLTSEHRGLLLLPVAFKRHLTFAEHRRLGGVLSGAGFGCWCRVGHSAASGSSSAALLPAFAQSGALAIWMRASGAVGMSSAAQNTSQQRERSRDGHSTAGLVVSVGALLCYSISWSRSHW